MAGTSDVRALRHVRGGGALDRPGRRRGRAAAGGPAAPGPRRQPGAGAVRAALRRLAEPVHADQPDRPERGGRPSGRLVAGSGEARRPADRPTRPRGGGADRDAGGAVMIREHRVVTVNLLTGFLGSGKTSLLKRLLA